MRVALVADIHSNLHALEAVLARVKELKPDRVICLGDIVGYNAFPSECIAMTAEHCDQIVMGNHDRESAGREPTIGTSSVARAAQIWTQAKLSESEMAWLNALPNKAIEPDVYIAVHGCYLNPEHVNGYVTNTMLAANLAAIEKETAWPRVAFCGHTHVPMLAWTVGKTGEITSEVPSAEHAWPVNARAVLINPGSVGQPRDFDPRAAFAIVDFDARTVTQHRVTYDVGLAAAAVMDAGLPNTLAARLEKGR